jgi:hypothetical protein
LILTMHLLDPVTGQLVASAGDILHRLEWRRGELLQESRVLWLDGVPQGQYALGLVLSPQAEPENRIAAYDGSTGESWAEQMVILDMPVLVLPAALSDLPVSSEGRIVAYSSASEVTTEPDHRVDAVFEGAGRLAGYTLDSADLVPGEDPELSLYWQAVNAEPPSRAYKVFVHLTDQAGQMLAQHDGEPVLRRRPTDTWQAGDLVIDPHKLEWQREDYSGPATLFVGLYDPDSSERLPAYGLDGERFPDDAVRLGEVQVHGPE